MKIGIVLKISFKEVYNELFLLFFLQLNHELE